MTTESFELGPIRPPSEAYSLLIRVTRNCPWNRCKFCHVYKGEKFELRPVEEIKQEILAVKAIQDKLKEIAQKSGYGERMEEVAAAILNNPLNEATFNVALWLYYGGTSAFLQDANTLIVKTPDLVEIIKFLKKTLPSITRVTSYGRSKTASKKKLEEFIELRKAGLSRLHIGLESGYDPLLKYMEKGVTAAEHIKGGKNIVKSGISLCEYVLLGLGGKKMWREHATETARVLNEINPDFIRVRTLTIKEGMPLYDEANNGTFVRATDEEIIEEEKLLIENLECQSNFISDHITNLLQELEGKLPQDKEKMLATIARFQSLSAEEKQNFKLGRRLGIYEGLDDLDNSFKHDSVERAIEKLNQDGRQVDEELIYSLMERFI
jgi:histone acetyltransferase (RNA polymerase elongator complex component)